MVADPSDGAPAHGLSGVSATLLTPLYGRARAAELVPGTAFRDPLATRLIEETGFRAPEVLTDRSNAAGAVHRAVVFDELTAAFAAHHPDGVVLSAGIGPDTRADRLASRTPGTIRWLGVDLPEVVRLRRELLPADRVHVYEGSLTAPGWSFGPAREAAGRPVLVLTEGVLMYLEPEGLRSFLDDCRAAFGPGTELVADYFHPRIALSGRHPITRATGAHFRSGARDGRALAATTPGWELLAEHGVMERISTAHRAAAGLFRALTLGARPYATAHLRATGDAPAVR
ncbi:class I SAM-dependent methyltransferase [Streptomyces sp. NPDC097619]|uniref:class I SAM-dependent methyltransferase n=1 Tax=Streptomyces sp. NPDC097619 TaxID=3157228 RepID=UPI00331ADED6